MSRNTWAVSIFSSGGTFVSDGTISVPNANFENPTEGTQVKVRLANGNNAFTVPETKFVKGTINFLWEALDKASADKITGYAQTSDILKIVDQNADEYFGKFINVRPVWLVGIVGKYDLQGLFQQMDDPS